MANIESEDRAWNEWNIGLTQAKKQHYVPQVFLRPFANEDGQLRVVDLEQGTEYLTSVVNAAAISRFYDLDLELDDAIELPPNSRISTEGWLSSLETEATPILRSLVSAPEAILQLSPTQENDLARFLAAFYFRVPAYRDWWRKIQRDVVRQRKAMAKNFAFNQFSSDPDLAAEIWKGWDGQPDHKWFGQEEETPETMHVAQILMGIQGFANLLRGVMDWRIGTCDGSTLLYSSDNPLAAHANPVREWWDRPGYANVDYYVPLSPRVMLTMSPRRPLPEGARQELTMGSRVVRNYGEWEASIGRHVVTNTATRFLFGSGVVVSPDCARECLARVDGIRVADAIRFHGFDPRPPRMHSPDESQ